MLDGKASSKCADDGEDNVDCGGWHIAVVVDREVPQMGLQWSTI